MGDEAPARPAHHDPSGGFRNPWEAAPDRSFRKVARWMWSRWRNGVPPTPGPEAFPRAESRIASPRGPAGETRITWIGHATALVQHGGVNVLTDPQWSVRAAPLQWIGPARLAEPGMAFESLPRIDAVLLSHDHYDHLDEGTVRRLASLPGGGPRWYTPLGYREWLAKRGVGEIVELDWWEEAELEGSGGSLRVAALPAQHWTNRGMGRQARLWASWSLRAPGERGVYFGGDSGYFPGFAEIGRRLGPFDACLLPIGAYDPRWMMSADHMNPEEAVRAYGDLGGEGLFMGIHWGTFRLTDEDPLEPPLRTRAAWSAAALPPEHLWIPKHGETRVLAPTTRR
jgi:N-acyl-phosphatidylethanolamine-hydrolysing phospholipase D